MSRERILPEILGVSASSLETWRRCPREYFDAHVLGLPESDAGRAPDYGNLVHAMLERIHRDGSCRDTAHVEEVLALHGIDADGALTGLVARHAQRCPSPAEHEKHELELARFYRADRRSWPPAASTRSGSTTGSSTSATTRPGPW